LYSELNSELLKFFTRRVVGRRTSAKRRIFSKVGSVVILCSEFSSELIVENFHQKGKGSEDEGDDDKEGGEEFELNVKDERFSSGTISQKSARY